MALGKDEEYLLQNVFTKVKYDELQEKYIIHLSDYLPLKLSSKQRKLLEEMCKQNNIELEKLPNKLTLNRETNELFREYDRLRKEISQNSNSKNIDKLKEQAIEVRNKLVEGYLEIMYKFITSLIPNIVNLQEKDDIYQQAYEILIDMIERFEVKKSTKFISYLYYYRYDKIINRIRYIGENKIPNKKLLLLMSIREKYIKENKKEPTIKYLSDKTGLPQERIEYLLDLEQLSSIVSLEAAIEELEQNEENKEENLNETQENIEEYKQYEAYLIDDSCQNHIYNIMFKELILKIVDTLPDNQKKVIILYYGLNNGPKYNLEEIAEILKIKPQRAAQLKDEAIVNLRLPIRAKYLQEIIKDHTEIIYPDIENNTIKQKESKKSIRQLMEFLIQYLPKEELIDTLNEIQPIYRDFLLLLFSFPNDSEYSRQEIIKKLNITAKKYYILKEKSLTILITKLKMKYSSNQNLINDEEFIDYLMYNYLNKTKKTLKRKKR